jgi:hypothetical protein
MAAAKSALGPKQLEELCVYPLHACTHARTSMGMRVHPYNGACGWLMRRVARPGRNQAVLDYLHTMGYTDAFEALQRQTGLEYVGDGKQKYSGTLEKKWTSVLRLQKKVCKRASQSARERAEETVCVCVCVCVCEGAYERWYGGIVCSWLPLLGSLAVCGRVCSRWTWRSRSHSCKRRWRRRLCARQRPRSTGFRARLKSLHSRATAVP